MSELTKEEQQLLAMALANMGEFIHENSPHYVLIQDPRNDQDYDTYEYGCEPVPGDHTWRSSAIDVTAETITTPTKLTQDDQG